MRGGNKILSRCRSSLAAMKPSLLLISSLANQAMQDKKAGQSMNSRLYLPKRELARSTICQQIVDLLIWPRRTGEMPKQSLRTAYAEGIVRRSGITPSSLVLDPLFAFLYP